MRKVAFLLLRISLGWLMVIWGADKLVNPSHGAAVAERFYFGLFGQAQFMTVYGVLQILLGVLVVVGLWRKLTYPVLAVVTGVTLVGVWQSVVDPWGWYLGRTNALFYPSLIVFAGVLVLMACRDLDKLSIDKR